MRTDQARREIMRSIRENLAASAAHDALERSGRHSHGAVAPLPGAPERAATPGGSRGIPLPVLSDLRTAPVSRPDTPSSTIEKFAERLRAVGGQVAIAGGKPEAARELARILQESGAERVVSSDSALSCELLAAAGAKFRVADAHGFSREELFACDVGVTTAQLGVADTGTLVLESAHERSRLVSLVPPVHVAVLLAADLCATLGEALARVSGDPPSIDSRAITFITGPSRTSDIELTLVIGVHGPQALHVIVLEETP